MLIYFIIFGILPISLGFGILKFDSNDNKNIFFAFPLGFFIEWLVFEIISVPMAFIGLSFYTLRNTWLIIMILLFAFSIYVNIKDLKEIAKQNIQIIKNMPRTLSIIFLIIVLFQCYVSFKYMHEDYDDSNFVAKATIAIDTNTLFVYDDQGLEYNQFPTRHIFSQFPYYTATISTIIGIHPAIMAHTILPVILLILAYDIYYLIGMSLFKNNYEKTFVFLILLSISYMFGAYSRYSIYVRLLSRLWQGKSSIVNIILPFIWYIFLEYIGKEKDTFYWWVLAVVLWSSVLLSSMALTLPIITAGLLTIIYMIKDKKIEYLFRLSLCCIPSISYGIIYLFIK